MSSHYNLCSIFPYSNFPLNSYIKNLHRGPLTQQTVTSSKLHSTEKSGSKCEQVLKVLAFLPPPAYVMTNVLIMQLAGSGLENAILSVVGM